MKSLRLPRVLLFGVAFRREGGFTLIETVVSLFIISVVILIYAAASNATILNRDAKHRQQANRIATSAMEDLRATPFASMPASGLLSDPLLASLPGAQGDIAISDFNADTKQITVTVSWQEPGARSAHSVILTTLKTKQGL